MVSSQPLRLKLGPGQGAVARRYLSYAIYANAGRSAGKRCLLINPFVSLLVECDHFGFRSLAWVGEGISVL